MQSFKTACWLFATLNITCYSALWLSLYKQELAGVGYNNYLHMPIGRPI